MTKQDFVSALAEKTGMTKKDADQFTKAFVEEIAEIMKAGDSIAFQ